MPLTAREREFLDAYVYEATHGPPFGGPATKDLAQRGIFYPDLRWILTAYDRERCAERRELLDTPNPRPPSSPWNTLEQVRQRNQVLQEELDSLEEGPGLGNQGGTKVLAKRRRRGSKNA